MRSDGRARTTMSLFIAALVFMLVGAGVGSRRAWSFSVDVPSPVIASMTAGPHAAVAEPPDGSAPPPTTGPPGGNPAAPGAPNPAATKPVAPSTSAPRTERAAPDQSRGASKLPIVIMGVVALAGGLLIVLYLVNRGGDDD